MYNAKKYINTMSNTKRYNFDFDYINKKFVKVFLNGVQQGDGQFEVHDRYLELSTNPPDGALLVVVRETPTTRLVQWEDSSTLLASNMNLESLQLLHITEEIEDKVVDIGFSVDYRTGKIDAHGKSIINVKDPTEPSEAITKHFLDTNNDNLSKQMEALKNLIKQQQDTLDETIKARQVQLEQRLEQAQESLKETLSNAQGSLKEELLGAQGSLKETLLSAQGDLKNELVSKQTALDENLKARQDSISQQLTRQQENLEARLSDKQSEYFRDLTAKQETIKNRLEASAQSLTSAQEEYLRNLTAKQAALKSQVETTQSDTLRALNQTRTELTQKIATADRELKTQLNSYTTRLDTSLRTVTNNLATLESRNAQAQEVLNRVSDIDRRFTENRQYVDERLRDVNVGNLEQRLNGVYTKVESDGRYATKQSLSAYQPRGNYLTSHQDISGLATKSELNEVRTLANQPKSYAHFHDQRYYTKEECDTRYQPRGNYLTSHQSLTHLATKSELDSRIRNIDLSNYYTKSVSDSLYATKAQLGNAGTSIIMNEYNEEGEIQNG